MSMYRFSDLLGNEKMTIVDAMSKIDNSGKGILFITDENSILKGCVTDGDIRRWLLKSGDLHAPITNAMMKSPKFLNKKERDRAEEVMNTYSIRALPIVEEDGKLIDVVFYKNCENVLEVTKNSDLMGVPVVIMAGGQGTRLYPYTKILPKPLIPVGETPIVERIINEYCKYGINCFYMTVNYKKNMIRSYFSDINSSYTIRYVEEEVPLGTGGSIRLIDERFSEPLFVTNCDALILADYVDVYKYHKNSGNDITIVSALKNVVVPYGVLHMGEGGEIISMEEKPKVSHFINTGMYIINPDTIDLIPADVMFHMPQLVERVMQEGGKVGMYPISEDSFLDMGEFSEMKRMEEKLHIVSN